MSSGMIMKVGFHHLHDPSCDVTVLLPRNRLGIPSTHYTTMDVSVTEGGGRMVILRGSTPYITFGPGWTPGQGYQIFLINKCQIIHGIMPKMPTRELNNAKKMPN